MTEIYGKKPDLISAQTLGVVKQALLMRYPIAPENGEVAAVPLTAKESPWVPGLRIIERGPAGATSGGISGDGLVAGTVRMGYGHYRIAYAVATHAMRHTDNVYLHDLLNVQAPGADMIREIDQGYSFFSRISADIGGPLEWAWGVLMSRGNINSLFFSDMLARELGSLIADLPRELPVVSAYPLHAQIAARAGFKNVINLVPDNYPQYFVLAPDCLNLVQGPAAYSKFRELGVPSDQLAVGGHWVSHDLSANAVADSEVRIRRAESKKTRRVLLPIGGAGAQRKYVADLLSALQGKLREKELFMFLNAGDHPKVFAGLSKALDELQIEYNLIDSHKALRSFIAANPLDGSDSADLKAVTLFHFSSHFEAFEATDLLMRISDVLATKPSELAFFPIPKLFLRRVGDHEAASVYRSRELGEGTIEAREIETAAHYVSLLCDEDDVFVQMNEAVISAARQGIYDGAKAAVELALARS
jgi:hypothetical protein